MKEMHEDVGNNILNTIIECYQIKSNAMGNNILKNIIILLIGEEEVEDYLKKYYDYVRSYQTIH